MGLFDKLFGGKKPEKEGNTEGTTKSGNAVNNAEGTSKTVPFSLGGLFLRIPA